MRRWASRRGPSPLSFPRFLFLFLLTRGVWPVSGNEGGTAGRCHCLKRTTLHPERLLRLHVESWDVCQESGQQYIRFILRNLSRCFQPDNPMVERLKEMISQKANARADASKGGQGPPTGTPKAQPEPRLPTDAPPTSKGPPTTQPDPRFPTGAPRTAGTKQGEEEEEEEETPAAQAPSEPPFTPGAAVGQPGRPPTPQQGSGPSQPAPRSSSSPHTTVAIVTLLGVVLLLVAAVAFLVCRRRRQNGPLHPAVLGEEENQRLNLPET